MPRGTVAGLDRSATLAVLGTPGEYGSAALRGVSCQDVGQVGDGPLDGGAGVLARGRKGKQPRGRPQIPKDVGNIHAVVDWILLSLTNNGIGGCLREGQQGGLRLAHGFGCHGANRGG